MAISTNYAQPVQVNGYTCKNCTDVDYAKKNIDPEHPKSGPFGVNAASDPSRTASAGRQDALAFGGALARSGAPSATGPSTPPPQTTGTTCDVRC